MRLLNKIDHILNNITMYRLLVYGLGGLAGLGIVFALFGRMAASPTAMIVSLVLLLGSTAGVDVLYGRIWRRPINQESWLITALILFLILPAPTTVSEGLALVLAGGIASVSKYILAWNGKHIANPAALAAVVVGFTGLLTTTWWVGSTFFWPFTVLLGLAVVRKIRRFTMVMTFGVIALILQAFVLFLGHREIGDNLKSVMLSSPIVFLASIMLTEPATMPPKRTQQMIFAAGVAVLYVMAWHIGPLRIYPETALIIGNIYAFIVSPKFRVRLTLTEVQKISDKVYNYVFRPDKTFNFLPGQYMEWTLAGVPYDSRGNRRTFTIASSPTESDVQVGLKYYEPASAFKTIFKQMQPGDVIFGSQLAGSFTITGNERKKMAFVAGGIGITPFRSMIKYLTDTNTTCDITLVYIVSNSSEFAYVREFRQAAALGVRFVPVVKPKIDQDTLAQWIPDYAERLFYISGPNAMVEKVTHCLRELRVPRWNIKTDHFSGY